MTGNEHALDLAAPFTRAQALEAGLTDRQLHAPRFRRLLDGVYVATSTALTPQLIVGALAVVTPDDAFASHATAARWHGCPLPTLPGEHVTVLSRTQRFRRAGVTCHTVQGTARITRLDDTRISSPAQCFVELATQLNLVDLVVVGDWLVRKGKVTLPALRDFCQHSLHRGAKGARIAASYVRERVDSPMETRLRMLIVLAGLPEPEVNLTIRDVDGEPIRRYDLSWPGAKVIVEYDGRQHVERVEQWEADLARREAIDDDGWRILVVISPGVYQHPEHTLERIHRLLRARRLPGVPPRLGDAWRPHFPGRVA